MHPTGPLAVVRRWQVAQREQFDPWTAWVWSLVTPGAGHLLALRWSGFLWLVADGVLLRLAVATSPLGQHAVPPAWLLVAWLVLGLAAGEQVRKAWIRPVDYSFRRAARSRVICHKRRGRALSISLQVDAALPCSAAWALVADLPRFHAIDPFHADITSSTGRFTPGTQLAIEHRALGMRWSRVGRLLCWREGCGYSFSDLSPRGRQVGFPHVFFVKVVPLGDRDSRIEIAVRGRWNQRWIPPGLGMCWVYSIVWLHARLLRFALS